MSLTDFYKKSNAVHAWKTVRCDSWLPEDKKADMWHGRGNSVAQRIMILAKNEDTCMKQLFKSNVLYVSS